MRRTYLLARWTLGVMPYSPNRVTNTLASVPAPLSSPVMVTTSYTGGFNDIIQMEVCFREEMRVKCEEISINTAGESVLLETEW